MGEASGRAEPARGVTRDRAAGLVICLVGLYAAWASREYPLGSLAEPGPGFLPLVLSMLLAVAGAAVAVRGGGPEIVRPASFAEARFVAVICGVLVLAAFAIERLGYRLTVIAMLVLLLGVIERRHPLAVAAVAGAMAFGTFYLINNVLRVPLPLGPWGL